MGYKVKFFSMFYELQTGAFNVVFEGATFSYLFQEFTVSVTEEFIEHALEGSLAIEVWGHRIGGSNSPHSNGWEVDNISAKTRTLADR